MSLSHVFQWIRTVLVSPLHIGALEISATSIKYLLIRGNTIVQASLRLPPGIIERGIIKNRPLFIAALKNLHAQITNSPKPITVILTIPSNLVFVQAFNVPMVAKDSLNEAIKLNLQMVSPNKIEESYYDYQEIKINKDLGHLDLLGAFTTMNPVNEFEKALRETGFIPVVVEFPGLSLSRLIRQRWGGIELEQQYLLIYLSGEGVLMMILKNGNLAFNHFTPWQDSQDTPHIGTLTFAQVKELIKREAQRVMNFYVSRTGKAIEEAVLISPVFNYEIVKLATEDLKLKIRNLSIAELPKLQPGWFPVLGAALRGTITRSKDTDISLSATGSQDEYYQERALEFIGLWRNILIGTFVVILAAFTLTDTVFRKERTQLMNQVNSSFDAAALKGSAAVQEKITAFNKLLDIIDETSKKETVWSPTLARLGKLAGTDVALDRVFITKSDLHGLITGHGTSDGAILAFKERLAGDSHVATVDLPLSNIKIEPGKSATFSLNNVFRSIDY